MTHTIQRSGRAGSSANLDIPTLVNHAPEQPLPAEVMRQLSAWLGTNIQSYRDLATVCHQGVRAGNFYQFQTQNRWLDSEIFDYVVSPSSLSYARSRNLVLGAVESSKCVAVMKVVALAQTVFDDAQEITEWLHTSSWDYRDKTPLEMLKTGWGAELLVDDLQQMEVVCL